MLESSISDEAYRIFRSVVTHTQLLIFFYLFNPHTNFLFASSLIYFQLTVSHNRRQFIVVLGCRTREERSGEADGVWTLLIFSWDCSVFRVWIR